MQKPTSDLKKMCLSTTWQSRRGLGKLCASMDKLIPLGSQVPHGTRGVLKSLAAQACPGFSAPVVPSSTGGGMVRGSVAAGMEPAGRELCQHRGAAAAEGSAEIPSGRVCECNSFQRETSKRLYQVQLSHCAFHLHTLARQSGVTTEYPFTVRAERSIIKVN